MMSSRRQPLRKDISSEFSRLKTADAICVMRVTELETQSSDGP